MGPLQRFNAICAADWQGKPIPQRRWLIPGLLIRGSVTMLNGDGGVGKSLLVQQLATAMATARPFLGIEPQPHPVRSLSIFCEDDAEELHFRQAQINAHYGCDMRDLGAMTMLSRVGLENGLMAFDRRTDEGKEMVFYHQLEHAIRESGAELTIIDTAADTFIGNENIRTQVRQFVGALRRLAKINDGGVILNAHPSLTGLNSGSGLSGSTAWHNTVRGRLYLTKPQTMEGEDDEETDQRLLKLMKSNYGRAGEKLRLVWRDHVFVLEERARGTGGTFVDRLELDNTVLAGLRRLVGNGVLVPADSQAKNGLAIRLRTFPSCRRWSWQAMTAAQERLVALGKIVKVELGSPSKRRLYVRPHDMTLPGEVGT
ncbi:MAG: AAA family ATPase [Alphaproteobacteria bacterium]|nr:AAA family ATPase [Alphaproteobacteria bacterium]MCW5741559.1 AAA family ATPase [Alphaproteobacteria bacterium]